MTREQLEKLFADNPDYSELAWEGLCQVCQKETKVVISLSSTGFTITGGAVYQPTQLPGQTFLKCPECYQSSAALDRFVPCEVYARIVGYMRPLSQWHSAKQEEFKTRKMFDKAVA
jgi:anaerobic ribonucleoside-triphosphate reductase